MRQQLGKMILSSVLAGTMALGVPFALPAVHAEAPLKDLDGSYAGKEIQALVEAGILAGYEDGTFQPGRAITRAELAKVLVLALGLEADEASAAPFEDVPEDAWYRGYVGALVKSGITNGTSANGFSPDAQVSRQELAVFFIRALGLEEGLASEASPPDVADRDEIADWAVRHIALAMQIGLFQGAPGENGQLRFAPGANADRQALARLTYEFHLNRDTYWKKAQFLAISSGADKPGTPEQGDGAAEAPAAPPPAGGGGGGGGGGGRSGSSNPPPVTQPAQTLAVLSGSAEIGGQSFAATVVGSNEIEFKLPESLDDKAMFTGLTVRATADSARLVLSMNGLTRTIEFEQGVASVTVSKILGSGIDKDGDGIALGLVRSLLAGGSYTGTISDASGNSKSVTLRITQ